MPRKRTGRHKGGQPGNRNARKTGAHTAQVHARRVAVRQMIQRMNAAVALANSLVPNATSSGGAHVITRARTSRDDPISLLHVDKMARPDDPGDDVFGK